MTERAPIVVAITGASGAPYAVRLLEALVRAEERVWLMVSSHGWRLLQMESGIGSLQELRERTNAAGWDSFVTLFDAEDRGAAPASGSARTRSTRRSSAPPTTSCRSRCAASSTTAAAAPT